MWYRKPILIICPETIESIFRSNSPISTVITIPINIKELIWIAISLFTTPSITWWGGTVWTSLACTFRIQNLVEAVAISSSTCPIYWPRIRITILASSIKKYNLWVWYTSIISTCSSSILGSLVLWTIFTYISWVFPNFLLELITVNLITNIVWLLISGVVLIWLIIILLIYTPKTISWYSVTPITVFTCSICFQDLLIIAYSPITIWWSIRVWFWFSVFTTCETTTVGKYYLPRSTFVSFTST